jgi:hypothetical protein
VFFMIEEFLWIGWRHVLTIETILTSSVYHTG